MQGASWREKEKEGIPLCGDNRHVKHIRNCIQYLPHWGGGEESDNLYCVGNVLWGLLFWGAVIEKESPHLGRANGWDAKCATFKMNLFRVSFVHKK